MTAPRILTPDGAEADRIDAAISAYPGVPVTTTNKTAARMLLMRMPVIYGMGRSWILTAPHIGAGVYRVTATERKEKRCICGK